MILRLFKSSQPAIIFLVPLTGGLLWIGSFIDPQTIPDYAHTMLLYDITAAWMNHSALWSQLTALLLLIITAFLLVRINTRFILLPSRTYLPGFIFMIIASLYPHLRFYNPALPAILLILAATSRMLRAYKKDGLSYAFFESSLLISLAGLFHALAAYYLIVAWMGLIYLRPFRWREWMMTVIGFLLPYLFLVAWYYFRETDILHLREMVVTGLKPVRNYEYFLFPWYLFYMYLGLLLLVSTINILSAYQGMKIIIRQFSKVFFSIFLVTAGLFVLLYSESSLLLYGSIPMAYLLSNFFFSIRSMLTGEVIMLLLLAAYVTVQVA